MRWFVLLAGCVVFLLGPAGCRNANRATGTDKGVTVVVEGGGKFPKSLVGRWKDEEKGWEFVFAKDGTISSAVIGIGHIKVTPKTKKTYRTPLDKGGQAVYKLGQWTVQYSPNTRELAVEVVLESLHYDFGSKGLTGQGSNWLVGPVAKDSQTWEAEWHALMEYTAISGSTEKEFPLKPGDDALHILIFEKQR
jgi:hypothetical protein